LAFKHLGKRGEGKKGNKLFSEREKETEQAIEVEDANNKLPTHLY
jgi:hypothetical protein